MYEKYNKKSEIKSQDFVSIYILFCAFNKSSNG
jgi:hypothetical protein